jgi:hypothetical protein
MQDINTKRPVCNQDCSFSDITLLINHLVLSNPLGNPIYGSSNTYMSQPNVVIPKKLNLPLA